MLIRQPEPMTALDRMFEDWTRTLSSVTRTNTLALDVTENDDAYTIVTDLPGIASEDIHVELDDDVLTIRAEVHHEAREDDDGQTLMQERRYGKFSRSVRFPVAVDADNIDADYENGVLTITVPKVTTAEPRRVAVTANR